jgi:hypothetical protein
VQFALPDLYQAIERPVRWLMSLLVVGGLGAVVAEYGFYLSATASALVHTVQEGVVWGFLLVFLVRLSVMPHRGEFLAHHKLQSTLVALLLLELLALQTAQGWHRKVLEAHDLHKVDVAIIAIGHDFEPAVLIAVELMQLGVKRLMARAESATQKQILTLLGVTDILSPEEEEVARYVAHRLLNPEIVDLFRLSDDYSPERFLGKTLTELKLRERFQCNVVAIKRLQPQQEGDKSPLSLAGSPAPDAPAGGGYARDTGPRKGYRAAHGNVSSNQEPPSLVGLRVEHVGLLQKARQEQTDATPASPPPLPPPGDAGRVPCQGAGL